MSISLKNYTLRYLVIAFLLIMAVWASLFYAYILDEVYDNVDDGLKNQKIEILREVYAHPELLQTREFGINQFRILPADEDSYSKKNRLSSALFYMPYDEEEEPYRLLQTGFVGPDEQLYHLEIRTSTVEEDDLIYDLTTALIVLYVLLVLSLYLINALVLRKAWKPFNTILENLSHYRFGVKDKLIPLQTNVLEFNKLHAEIQRMWMRNENLFEEQKLFIENAAHELQTPLAITINKFDLLLDDEALNEKQLTQIADAKASLLRLVNLNKSLLMLSRIDNKQYRNISLVSFKTVTEGLIEELQDFIDYKQLKLFWDVQGDFVQEMDVDLASILISNLLRNAIKYSPLAGELKISLSATEFLVTNESQGKALDGEVVFKRFHKESSDKSSTGLGLAIVKSIVSTYPALEIRYDFLDGLHVFSLRK